jgi:hypothetical protein
MIRYELQFLPISNQRRTFQVEQGYKVYSAWIRLFQNESTDIVRCNVLQNYEKSSELTRCVKRKRYQYKRWRQERRQPASVNVGIFSTELTVKSVQYFNRAGFEFDSHMVAWDF